LLFGGIATSGVSIEVHEFSSPVELDWGRSFHLDSVELCLNLRGSGRVGMRRDVAEVSRATALCYSIGEAPPVAERAATEEHLFLTMEFRRDYLERHLAHADQVDPILRGSEKAGRKSAIGKPKRLSSAQQQLVQRLCDPPVSPAALPIWYEAKVLEAIAEFLFTPSQEFFCHRQQRLAQERVERACEILRQRLEAPPTLEELGREVGVSQFYLSRIFSQEMRMTIPQYLRQVRMEAAARLLKEGRHNVTEAAFAVGYASLGHFSKSFCEVIGCCPTLYPMAKNLTPQR
jgi:AraC-like DNA-binding protein